MKFGIFARMGEKIVKERMKGCRPLKTASMSAWTTLKRKVGYYLEDLDCRIFGARSQAPAIRGPGQLLDSSPMAEIDQAGLSRHRVPDLHGAIIPTGSQALAIGRPPYLCHRTGIGAIGQQLASSGGLPHLYCAIHA